MTPEQRYANALARGVAPWPKDRPGGPAHGLPPEEITRRCAESRAAQGLPPGIEDPATVERIVAILRTPWEEAS